MQDKVRALLEEKLNQELPEGHIPASFMREIQEMWNRRASALGMKFVYGSGRRKEHLQKDIATLTNF